MCQGLKGFEAANPRKPSLFSSAWQSLTQIKEIWVKHVCLATLSFDMLEWHFWRFFWVNLAPVGFARCSG